MPNTRTPNGGYLRASDPKRNAGISLTAAEIAKLDEYKAKFNLSSRSEVVAMLIRQKLPELLRGLKLSR